MNTVSVYTLSWKNVNIAKQTNLTNKNDIHHLSNNVKKKTDPCKNQEVQLMSTLTFNKVMSLYSSRKSAIMWIFFLSILSLCETS